jgi:hypothetical protein
MKKIILILVLFVMGQFAFSQTKTELQTSELQKPIIEHIDKNFSGFSIGKIFKVDAKGTITYDICVNKGTTYEKLIYDKDGKFLKKESCSFECCQPTTKK